MRRHRDEQQQDDNDQEGSIEEAIEEIEKPYVQIYEEEEHRNNNHHPKNRRSSRQMIKDATTTNNKKKKHHDYNNKRHEFAFIKGFSDMDGYPILDDDYYATMGTYGFYDDAHLLNNGAPITHSTETTSVLQYYNTWLKKTPLDTRYDVKRLDLSQVALDYKNAELYNIQNWSKTAAERIREKSHRIMHDPTRTFQSQTLIDIQENYNKLLKDPTIPQITKLVEYHQMSLTVSLLLLERITDILDYNEKILMFQKQESKPLGKNFYAEMTLKAGADATKLDFRDDTNNKNIPSGSIIKELPKHALLSLNLIFDSGTNMHFATNMPTNSLETVAKLTSPPQSYTIVPGQFSINSLNLMADTTDAVVRIIGLY